MPRVKTDNSKPKDRQCAPTKNFLDGSCYSVNDVAAIVDAYNKEGLKGKKKIRTDNRLLILNPKKYKKYLIEKMTDRMEGICNDQKCWLRQRFMKNMEKQRRDDLVNNTFRPEGPSGKFTWLNTFNIQEVMKQYEKKFPDFQFLGAVPMDFDDLPELGIKNMNFKKKHDDGKKRLGIVFNLDEHYKSGSHWVGMYIDLQKGQLYYFDSYGVVPEKRVRNLMKRICKACVNELGIDQKKFDLRSNNIRHQFKNSECGVYSMNFIIRLLNGETFDYITENATYDDDMNKCRSVYFN
jgi:hypothetical protein